MTRAVLEHGDLQAAIEVPDTIQGVLMARLDRLPEAPKRLLQTASVLGWEFSLHLLASIWDGPEAPPTLLQELTRLEFLYARTGVEEPTYVFKHALTQEVAYESLLTTRRQALHAAAGQALEALYGERLSAEARDRCVLDMAIRQAECLFYLGRRQEAVTLLLGYHEPVQWFQDAVLAKGNYTAALPVLEQAVQEAMQYRSAQVQSWFKAFLGEAYRINQQLDRTQELAQQGLELARRIASWWGAALAQRPLGRLAHSRGNLAEARVYFEEARDTFASIHSRFELARTHLDLAALAHAQGDPRSRGSASQHRPCLVYALADAQVYRTRRSPGAGVWPDAHRGTTGGPVMTAYALLVRAG